MSIGIEAASPSAVSGRRLVDEDLRSPAGRMAFDLLPLTRLVHREYPPAKDAGAK